MPPRNTQEEEAAYERDRARFFAQGRGTDLDGQPAQAFTSTPQARSASTINEVYASCAQEVVALTKCVDNAGPTWYFQCGDPYIAMQKCYNKNKSWESESTSLSTRLGRVKDQMMAGASLRLEQWQWFFSDVFGRK